MNSIIATRKIIRSISWNASEAIGYHILLACHQMALFKTVSYETYGAIGTAFSILYLAIWIIDLGFESALAPFWSSWSLSKQSVKNFLLYNSMPTFAIWSFLTVSLLLLPTAFGYHLSSPITILIAIAALSEGIRRICKVIMQLLFENRLIALAETIFMSSYLAMVWLSYAMGSTPTIATTLIPLIISSAAAVCFSLWILHHWYRSLDYTPNALVVPPTTMRIARLRLFAYGNAISILFFSSNFLVPLFAIRFGAGHAGLLKLASSMVHSITVVLQRTFGNTCRALLAHLRSAEDMDQQEAFLTITHYLYQILYALLIFCAVNHRFIANICGAADAHGGTLLALFFVISFLDNFAITYDKLYEINERSDLLLIFNGLGACLIMLLAAPITSWASPVTLLLLVALIRVSVLALTTGMTFALYHISPHKTMQPAFILSAIAGSLLFFIGFGCL